MSNLGIHNGLDSYGWANYRQSAQPVTSPPPTKQSPPAEAVARQPNPIEPAAQEPAKMSQLTSPKNRLANDSLKSLIQSAGQILEHQERMLSDVQQLVQPGRAAQAYQANSDLLDG